ncbi:nitrogenase component 1 [Rhodopseudomonas sp.]|uniref:nitrogenase component 1 n=1 Tax=Rhodopseudomonas sp. TaxID=1078 RepID=UPI003B3BBF2B
MASHLIRPRAGCALHGALYTATAIDGVTPLVHATPGCSVAAGLWQSQHGCGNAAPASNLSEKHIVFGGASRLREQIKNTRGIVRGALTVVMTGCPAEMIGDDVAAMAQEARDAGDDVLDLATAGFRGSAYHGYASLLEAAIGSSVTAPPRHAGLVNILGPVPQQDPFWLAEIAELSRLIAGVGLAPNPVFGPRGGLDSLRSLGRAELTLSVSPWSSGASRLLDDRFDIPWVESGGVPVGARATSSLLEQLLVAVGEVDDAAALAFIDAERRHEAYCLDGLLETLFRQGGPRTFAIAAPSLHATSVARFLIETLGWLPATILVTDNPPVGERALLQGDLASLRYVEDDDEINRAIVESGAEILFGSALERGAARALRAPLIECAAPTRRLSLTTGFGGFRGSLALLEAIITAVDQQL